MTKFGRVIRLATLPETRGVIFAAARSATLRDMARRVANDRSALLRDVRHPRDVRAAVRSAVRHPAARELAGAGLLFLPGRYLPLGWAATWATERVLRRYMNRRYMNPPAAPTLRALSASSRTTLR